MPCVYLIARTTDELCGAYIVRGGTWSCSRRRGHTGEHHAHSSHSQSPNACADHINEDAGLTNYLHHREEVSSPEQQPEVNDMPETQKLYVATTRAVLPEDSDSDEPTISVELECTDFLRIALQKFVVGSKSKKLDINGQIFKRPLLKRYLVETSRMNSALFYALTEEFEEEAKLVIDFSERDEATDFVNNLQSDAQRIMQAFSAVGTKRVSAIIEESED